MVRLAFRVGTPRESKAQVSSLMSHAANMRSNVRENMACAIEKYNPNRGAPL